MTDAPTPRDVLTAATWQVDCDIAGAPEPRPTWEQFRELDPETAAIYITQAGCYLSALHAAGYVVVPREVLADAISSLEYHMRSYRPDLRYDGTFDPDSVLGRAHAALKDTAP
jgi:hypothetical protein